MTPYQEAVLAAYKQKAPVFCHMLTIKGKKADNTQSVSLTLNGLVMKTITRTYGAPKAAYPNGAQFLASGLPYTALDSRFGDILVADGTVIRLYSPGWFQNVDSNEGRATLLASVVGPNAFKVGLVGASGSNPTSVSEVRVSQHDKNFTYRYDERGGSGDWINQLAILDHSLIVNACMDDEPIDFTKNSCGY